MQVGTGMPWHTCENQRITCRQEMLFSFHHIKVAGVELRFSLAFQHSFQVISPAPFLSFFFFFFEKSSHYIAQVTWN